MHGLNFQSSSEFKFLEAILKQLKFSFQSSSEFKGHEATAKLLTQILFQSSSEFKVKRIL